MTMPHSCLSLYWKENIRGSIGPFGIGLPNMAWKYMELMGNSK